MQINAYWFTTVRDVFQAHTCIFFKVKTGEILEIAELSIPCFTAAP